MGRPRGMAFHFPFLSISFSYFSFYIHLISCFFSLFSFFVFHTFNSYCRITFAGAKASTIIGLDPFWIIVSPEALGLPVTLNFHKRFEFLKLSKYLIIRFNGVYLKKVGKIINEGEEELSSPNRCSHRPIYITIN